MMLRMVSMVFRMILNFTLDLEVSNLFRMFT
jgi:hypothetical protein